jgi:AcrR family transcriptional regulator
VFQHFDDLEALYATCVRHQQIRIAPLLTPIDASAPRAKRIESFVAQRARLYKRIAPVRRAVRVAALNSPALSEGLAGMTAEHRRAVGAVFARELFGDPSRRELLAALEVTTCFDTWEHLRRTQGCSVAVARGVVARLVEGVLAEAA